MKSVSIASEQRARPAPAWLAQATIYQLFLRPFTPEGTLKQAAKLLPHIADLGVDCVYLCPIVEADDSPARRYWSERQKKSGFNNPRNPYRIKDYYKIDPEYGTATEFRAFVEQAHGLGLRILLDLVYGHCGPKCNLIADMPDCVQRHPNGCIRYTLYHFPAINFASRALREYFLANMEYFVREFGIDGYRTDMEHVVPLDFWEEARRRLERLRPDIVMLAESNRPECQLKAYDLNYAVQWGWTLRRKIFEDGGSAALLRAYVNNTERPTFPQGARFIRMLNNHDWSQNDENPENTIGPDGVDAILAVICASDGVPFLYNGVEIADNHRHSIYSNRDFGGLCINWCHAVTPRGRERLKFLKRLLALRRSQSALTRGTTRWIETNQPAEVIAFARTHRQATVLLVCNTRNRNITVRVKETIRGEVKPLFVHRASWTRAAQTVTCKLGPYSFALLKYQG